MRAMTDAERIRGQAERGEIRIGPGAARQIAALAEAAYGAAWPANHPCRTEQKEAPPVPRLARRPIVDHSAVAADARSKPGQWVRAGEYRSTQSAKATAACIRAAGGSQLRTAGLHYGPPGAYDAGTQLTEYGCDVLVRYVGDQVWDDALAALGGDA